MKNTRDQLPTDPVEHLWRGTQVLRVVTLAFAIGSAVVHHEDYLQPWLAWLVITIMFIWSGAILRAYHTPAGRQNWVVALDVVVVCALMGLSRLVLSVDQLQEGAPLITTLWASSPAIAAGALGSPVAGATAGLAIGVTTFLTRGAINIDVIRDVVLLVGAGAIVGFSAKTARHSTNRLSKALRIEAATAERERLARTIHDGVLQVLAHINKRGLEVGGAASELAALAGEQEVALRTIVAQRSNDYSAKSASGEDTLDLCESLHRMATPRVHISTPATPVLLPVVMAGELIAAVNEALSNVDKHAGDHAQAWVLLEDLGEEVVLSIRDDGLGMASQRLRIAETEGRMGVVKSIRGRIADLGGVATLHTSVGEGTEWEIRVKRHQATM